MRGQQDELCECHARQKANVSRNPANKKAKKVSFDKAVAGTIDKQLGDREQEIKKEKHSEEDVKGCISSLIQGMIPIPVA